MVNTYPTPRKAIGPGLYPDQQAYWNDLGQAYAGAVKAFADAGCRYLQIDDCSFAYFCDPDQVKMLTDRGDDPKSLPDHFARHGADFRAKDADDYARMAWEFGQRAKQGGLLVKADDDGTRRVFDPKSGAFAAYNRDGTTKTFFKPNSRDYFARQPGRPVTARAP